MVDQLQKLFNQEPAYRVDAQRDALEEDGKKGGGEEEGDEAPNDAFDKLRNNKDLQQLFDKAHLWQRNIEIKVEDIDKIKILGLNLNTEPSLLKIRVFLFDGSVIPTALLAVSRALAFRIHAAKRHSAFVDVNLLTKGTTLSFTIPKDEQQVDEEITRITHTTKEKTFSETFKVFLSKRSWLQRLGIEDPVSRRVNSEVLWIYVTVFFLLAIFGLGLIYFEYF